MLAIEVDFFNAALFIKVMDNTVFPVPRFQPGNEAVLKAMP